MTEDHIAIIAALVAVLGNLINCFRIKAERSYQGRPMKWWAIW